MTAVCIQGLIQKEKVSIDGEKGAQISVAAEKIVTQRWSEIIILNYNLVFLFSLLCLYYVTDLVKKLELSLLVTFSFHGIKFGHAHISVPKIGKPMSKKFCVNPWYNNNMRAGRYLDQTQAIEH